MHRLLYVVTHPITAAKLMEGQLAFMREKGFEVHLISSPSRELDMVRDREKISTIPLKMQREIHPVQDLISLIRLYRAIRRLQPVIVNAGTPKAGLLGMVAAYWARVPVRIYILRGLRLETKKGPVRFLLKMTERIASSRATRVISVSESLRQTYVSMNLAPESKITVLGRGSSNGIKLEPASGGIDRKALRAKLGIPEEDILAGFVGRLVRDKGITELIDAFDIVLKKHPETTLLIVGDFESGDPLPASTVERIKNHPRIVCTGFVEHTAPLYQIMDFLVFPSHREGFPNAPLEAASYSVPVVGYRVTGTVDAIEEGHTGILVPLADQGALADAICEYIENEKLRQTHGEAARKRASENFRQEVVWENLYQEYIRLMKQHFLDAGHPAEPENVYSA